MKTIEDVYPEAIKLVGDLFSEMNNQHDNEFPLFNNWKSVIESGTPSRALIHAKESGMKLISNIGEIDGLTFSHMLNDTIPVLCDTNYKGK